MTKQEKHAEISFDKIDLSDSMQAALKNADYQIATTVQAGVIPLAIVGKDVIGQARTGTGKTAAFAIPIIEQLSIQPRIKKPRAVVLVPTRELAVQVRDEVAKLAKGQKIRTIAVYGGKPIKQQIDKLHKGVDILVGTPGRVLDLMGRGPLQLDSVQIAVLDEADRMLDIGFRQDIEKILRRCPTKRQTLLLSATISSSVERLAQRYMYQPTTLNFSPKQLSVETIEQRYFTVDEDRKFDLLLKLLDREKPRQSIVFCRTKRGTDRLYNRLRKKMQGVDCIHGDLAQNIRDRVMKKFRDGTFRFLIATDVVGRGIDVTGVSHIINFDLPQFSEDYVHRVGRTGRMGREGVAYSFVTPEQGIELTRIEIKINTLLKRDEIAGFQCVAAQQPVEEKTPEEVKEIEKKKAAVAKLSNRRGNRRHRRAL